MDHELIMQPIKCVYLILVSYRGGKLKYIQKMVESFRHLKLTTHHINTYYGAELIYGVKEKGFFLSNQRAPFSWVLCYKTFYGRKFQIFKVS